MNQIREQNGERFLSDGGEWRDSETAIRDERGTLTRMYWYTYLGKGGNPESGPPSARTTSPGHWGTEPFRT